MCNNRSVSIKIQIIVIGYENFLTQKDQFLIPFSFLLLSSPFLINEGYCLEANVEDFIDFKIIGDLYILCHGAVFCNFIWTLSYIYMYSTQHRSFLWISKGPNWISIKFYIVSSNCVMIQVLFFRRILNIVISRKGWLSPIFITTQTEENIFIYSHSKDLLFWNTSSNK